MPYDEPISRPVRAGGPRRRSLLAGAVTAAGAALLAGCSDDGADSGSSGAAGRRRTAAQVRAALAKDSAGLLAEYEAAIAAHPALLDRLGPLRAEVLAHVEALGGAPAAQPSPAQSAPVQTLGEKVTLRRLAEAERALADSRRGTLAELPGEDARLLASIAAAGDVHAYLLSEAAR
ncbi:hypothetical protein [Streptomyces indicus]|uniref:Lipoprotein n=1 Tax=Streptomyces indicus TaxID=417292 RepID=A0A1G8VU26_9ACTN|nr:hypothetical protein [Streptomyces indicus]SDJ69578.1 hypothetical protein SAMN05421806_10245 [Streptomyces indicus]